MALSHPAVGQTLGRFEKADAGLWRTAPCHEYYLPIAQLRWDPAPIPKEDKTFCRAC